MLRTIKITIICFCLIQYLYAQDSTSINLIPVEILGKVINMVDNISIGRSQFLSYPASFDDPARLLIKYPGYTIVNDQNNAIIYDALPSHYSSWSLYGAPILNPNHLSEAGTPSERLNTSAGGVNMISGQMIGSLDYHTDYSGPNYSIGGVADISLRTPYKNSYNYNLSLIGLEAGADFLKNNKSLVINYRHSTIGLLNKLGVDFGDEEINYRDFMAEYQRKIKSGKLRIMSVIGKSENLHDRIAQQGEDHIISKDIQDIYFEGRTILSAINYNNTNTNITLSYSNRRDQKNIYMDYDGQYISRLGSIDDNLFASYIKKTYQLSDFEFILSLASTFNQSNIHEDKTDDKAILFNADYTTHRAKLNITYHINSNYKVTPGIDIIFDRQNKERYINPSINLKINYPDFKSSFTLAQNGQSTSSFIKGMTRFNYYSNLRLDYINALLAEAKIDYKNFSFRAFHRIIKDVPINVSGNFIALDELTKLPNQRYINKGLAKISGASIMTHYNYSDYKYSITLNYTTSNYGGNQLPLDSGLTFNFRLDKLYNISANKYLRIGLSYHNRGEHREKFIDLMKSQEALRTVYDLEQEGYQRKIGRYQRLDARISYIKQNKYKSVLSLDIQNVLNKQNDGYYYYDFIQENEVLQRQLGLLPVLSWRFTF